MENGVTKNKDFFWLQYNKIKWKNQEKTKINFLINKTVIQKVIMNHRSDTVTIFDIGFGVGFFLKMLIDELNKKYQKIIIEGCEPSRANYDYYSKQRPRLTGHNIVLNTYKNTFQDVKTKTKFDFITAIYVFPHFPSEDLEEIIRKIYSMLNDGGKFILVIADDEYLKKKLATEKDLFIESRKIIYNNKKYNEFLHYSDIPKIGKVIDYNRKSAYYLDLFKRNGFDLNHKETVNDNGFLCILLVFEKR